MKRFLASAFLALALGVPLAFGAGKEAAKTPLQNVEVLDPSMALRDARRFMVQFNQALGVSCRDCHVLRDFTLDDKPLKVRAREMMKMQRDLNAKWFAGADVVNCWTCHRGSRVPPTTLTLSGSSPQQTRAPETLPAATADSLVEGASAAE